MGLLTEVWDFFEDVGQGKGFTDSLKKGLDKDEARVTASERLRQGRGHSSKLDGICTAKGCDGRCGFARYTDPLSDQILPTDKGEDIELLPGNYLPPGDHAPNRVPNEKPVIDVEGKEVK